MAAKEFDVEVQDSLGRTSMLRVVLASEHRSALAPSESGRPDWIWSLEQPEVSGVRWIETWDENALELGVRRFAVGDTLPPNVACWRYGEASLSTVLWAFPAGVAAGKAAEEIQDARQRRKWRANEPF